MGKVYLEIHECGIDWCSTSKSRGYIGIDKKYVKEIKCNWAELTDEGVKVAEELSGIAPLNGYIPYLFIVVGETEIERIIARLKKEFNQLKKQMKSLGVEEY